MKTGRIHRDNGGDGVSRFGFLITILYFIFDYGRPQDKIGGLDIIHPSMILTILMFVALVARGNLFRLASSPQTLRIYLLLILFAAYIPFVVNNGRAFLTTKLFLILIITFHSFVVFVNTIDRLKLFMKVWVWLTIYLAIDGTLHLGSAGSSFLRDENDFSLIMDMMLPFGIFLFIYEKTTKMKLVYLLAGGLSLVSIVVSFSRGGFLGLVAVAFVLWLQVRRKVLTLSIASVILVILINLPMHHSGTTKKNSTFWQEMSTIDSGNDYNKDSRLELWKSAWAMFKDNPLGVGPQNYPVRLPDYQTKYFGDKNMWGKEAHSIWFTVLAELGIPGVLLYFSLLFKNYQDIRFLKRLPAEGSDMQRFAHFLSLAYAASMAGYLVAGTFLSVLYYPHYWYLTAMIVATRKIVERENMPDQIPEKTMTRINRYPVMNRH